MFPHLELFEWTKCRLITKRQFSGIRQCEQSTITGVWLSVHIYQVKGQDIYGRLHVWTYPFFQFLLDTGSPQTIVYTHWTRPAVNWICQALNITQCFVVCITWIKGFLGGRGSNCCGLSLHCGDCHPITCGCCCFSSPWVALIMPPLWCRLENSPIFERQIELW